MFATHEFASEELLRSETTSLFSMSAGVFPHVPIHGLSKSNLASWAAIALKNCWSPQKRPRLQSVRRALDISDARVCLGITPRDISYLSAAICRSVLLLQIETSPASLPPDHDIMGVILQTGSGLGGFSASGRGLDSFG